MGGTEAAQTIGGSPSTETGTANALFAPGERIATSADNPFLLSGDRLWFVAAGQVDIFTVRVKDGTPSGSRVHLLRATEGATLFGAGPAAADAQWGMLAVPTQHAHILMLPRGLVADAQLPDCIPLIEAWIQSLYAGLVGDNARTPVSTDLPPGQETEVAERSCTRPRSELAWMRHTEGYSRLLGRAGLEVAGEGFVPVSRRGWLEAGTAGRILSVETRDLLSPLDLWEGLERLHDLVLRNADLAARGDDRAFHERMQQRGAFQQAMLRDACERLVGTADRGSRPAPGARDDGMPAVVEDPLLAACMMVGRALEISIRGYPRTDGRPAPVDPFAAILRASRVRSRQVALRGEWWREDNGPLLAYLTDGKKPVALLRPTASGAYVLHDPATHTHRPVDASVAETIEPFAQALYRPFPERRLRARDLARFALHGCRRDINVLIAMAICGALLGMVPSVATGILFNTVIPGAQRSQLLQMTMVLLACAGAIALFGVAQEIALLRLEGRASAALQSAVWDRLLALPLGFFRPYTSGDLATRAMSIDAMRQAISGSTTTALLGLILALGNFALMFWYSWRMALWATLIIFVVMLATLVGSAVTLRPQRAAIALQSKAAGLVLQLLMGIAKLRVAAAEVPAFGLWARRFGEQRQLQFRARSTANWVAAFNAAVPVLSYLIIFAVARPMIMDRSVPTGDFLAFLTAFSAASTSIIGASLALLATLNTVPLYEQAKPILDTLPEVDLAKNDPGPLTGDIEVQHAMFRYQQDGPLVLRDVSFRIRQGEFVAFVGPSGSGKSTLLRLLLGFETLEAGTIYFDGQEIGGLDIQALRRQMGVVLQSGRLMSGDIFTNIIGSSGANLEAAWEAARMAGLEEDIEAMPMGMHTVVSEGGGTLSGGQRQRLLIARAIVSKPRMLLFDEATSALDNRTQAIVSASLESLQATRIVVAHRLSTIVHADRIFVLERGRLVQHGSYQQLLREKGPFAELAARQIA